MHTAFRIVEGWRDDSINRTDLAWASLFHDCCKELSPKEVKALLAEGDLPYGEELMSSPVLAHGPLGALFVKTRYGVLAHEVLQTITYHSTGHPDLCPMGWSVYIADFIEPGRKYLENHEALIRLAQENPLEALRRTSEWRLSKFLEKQKSIHPITYQVQEFLNSVESFPSALAT